MATDTPNIETTIETTIQVGAGGLELPPPELSGDLALHLDAYGLTMLDGALVSGVFDHAAAFEVFARSVPGGRFGVFAGLGRLLDALENFAFAADDLAWLVEVGLISRRLADWLAGYRFRGRVIAYPEGELYFPNSPVLRIEGKFYDILLETLVLSILNADSGVATKAARIVAVAGGTSLADNGTRRTHEEAAVAAARAAYIGGFDTTSNLAAGRRYGIPVTGTAAHSFTLAHPSEAEAFAAQVEAQGPKTTLLLDTYDIAGAVATGVAIAGTGLGAGRIDSGDLNEGSGAVRAQLDGLGATGTLIRVSGDLDEYQVDTLTRAGAPIDSFAVGTRLVTGYPPPGFVFKLVEIFDAPDTAPRFVAKKGGDKATVGGPKEAGRQVRDGRALAELIGRPGDLVGISGVRLLQEVAMDGGVRLDHDDLATIRTRCADAMAELGDVVTDLEGTTPALVTIWGPGMKPGVSTQVTDPVAPTVAVEGSHIAAPDSISTTQNTPNPTTTDKDV